MMIEKTPEILALARQLAALKPSDLSDLAEVLVHDLGDLGFDVASDLAAYLDAQIFDREHAGAWDEEDLGSL